MAHWSDCAVHNPPAMPAGPCDCGNDAPEPRTLDDIDPAPKQKVSPDMQRAIEQTQKNIRKAFRR